MTPGMSLSRSHRLTCTTSLASGDGGGVRAAPLDPAASSPASRPARRRIRTRSAGAIGRFFSERGSIDGGMTLIRSGESQAGAYWRREKIVASTGSR